MKIFWNYLKERNVIITILSVVLCSITYILRETIEFQKQTVIYINLTAVCVFMVILFNTVRKNYNQWCYMICILLLFFVFNRFYDERVFYKTFHFELSHFLICLVTIVVFVIINPFMKKAFGKVSNLLEKWTQHRIKDDGGDKSKTVEHPETRVKTKVTRKNRMSDEMAESDEVEDKEHSTKRKTGQKNTASYLVLFWVVFILLLLFPVVFLFFCFFFTSFRCDKKSNC